MALDLGDLDEFFDASMTFTIAGKQYSAPPTSAELGIWGRRVVALRADVPDDATEKETAAALARAEKEIGPPPIPKGQTFAEGLLSAALVAELVADGVSDQAIEHLAGVAYARIIAGDAVALHVFRGDDPNAPSPANRQERRAVKKATPRKASSSRTTSTAAGSTTRKAASGSTTKSQSKPVKAAKATSPGRKS